MLSLSDATQLESLGDKAVTRFRPWWEVFTFYCLNGLLMAVLFALAGITISGTYNIWCFPLGNDTAVDYNIINYASSRCSRIFDGNYLIYFPYWMFLEWAVFFAVHLLWFKLPATFFLFQQLSEVFSEFSTIKPVEYNTQKRNSRGNAGLSSKLTGLRLGENKGTKQKVRNLVDRLMKIVKEDNRLVFMYTVKAIFLCVSNAVVVIVLAQWLYSRQWHASFPCDLSNHIPVIYEDLTCSLPAAPFLYGLMIVNVIFAFCICLCNIAALWWVVKFRTFTFSDYKHAFQKWTSLVNNKGFLDFCFCLDLTTCTSKDGKILGDIIYSSLKLYQKSGKYTSYVELIQEMNKKAKFSSKFFQGQVIAKELGLKISEGRISDDCLFDAIAKVTGTDDTEAVCDTVAEELIINMFVYKDLVDNDMNCPLFEECVELIQTERKTPKEFHHYALMAACNAFHVNILLLTASTKCWFYKTTQVGSPSDVPVKYLFYIYPGYYTPVVDEPGEEDKQNNRQLFISNKDYRRQLQVKAQNSWEDDGKRIYQNTMKTLNPQIIAYGKHVPPAKRPTNILSDLFNETGQKISKQILSKIYIPGVTNQQL